MKCVSYLPDVLPFLLNILKICSRGLRESILQQLAQMAAIVQYHITPYLPLIFDTLCTFWSEHLEFILNIIEEIAISAPDEFSSYIPRLMPMILSTLTISKNIQLTESSISSYISNNNSSSISAYNTLSAEASLSQSTSPPTPQISAFHQVEATLLCVDGLCIMLKGYVR